jgi:hypothetical protein
MSGPSQVSRALAGTKTVLGRRWVRRTLVVAGGTVALILLARPAAIGGDLLSNVGPASQLEDGALMDAHPLGHYVLDHHFSAVKAGVLSGVDVSGIPPTIAWFLANTLWQLTAFIAHALITLFTFAFSLDLVGGSGATGGASALEPVGRAVRSIYQRTFGEPWLIVAVLLAGLWAIYNALVRRRYVETAGSLAVSVVYVVIALAFVTQPERTIGTASSWSNAMSGAFLSLTSQGTVGDQGRAKQGAADQLFTLLVYEPWSVLQFGGREHCVKAPVQDKPQSVAVRPLSTDPARDGTLSRRLQRTDGVQADGKVCVSNRNKHAPRFLRHSSGSDEREKLYEAVKDGNKNKLDNDDPAKQDSAYGLGPADKPAAEAMGKGGQYERLLMAIVIFAGELGIFLLLGALSVSVILAQVLVLLLLAFAPVALVVGVFPGRGHAFFLGWLSKLAAFLLRKAIYSLILAVLLAVGAAINDATSNLGWLMAFGLQGAFFWAVFLFRHQLTGQLSVATTGAKSNEGSQTVRLATLYAAVRMARGTLSSGGGRATRGRDRGGDSASASTSAGLSADAPPPADPASSEPPTRPSGPRPEGPVAGAGSSRASDTTVEASAAARRASAVGDARKSGETRSAGASSPPHGSVPSTLAPTTSAGAPATAEAAEVSRAESARDARVDRRPSTAQADQVAQRVHGSGQRASTTPADGRRRADQRAGTRRTAPPVSPAPPETPGESSDRSATAARSAPREHATAAQPYPDHAPPEAGNPLERDLTGDAQRLDPEARPERGQATEFDGSPGSAGNHDR